MPLDLQAYERAQSSIVLFELKNYAKIEIMGADHETFLHHILSQNMLEMALGEWRETALLSATSHVLAYFYAIKQERSILLLCPSQSPEKIRALLDKFLITEDVQMNDAEESWNLFEIWGPEAGMLIQENAASKLIYKPEGKNGARTLVLTNSKMIFENACLPDRQEKFESDDLREVLRIENKILEFGIDFDEKIMLSETRLEKKASSETKGCYPGQEVVAKIETYKRLNRSFVGLVFDANFSSVAVGSLLNISSELAAQPGAILCDIKSGEEIGRLTSRAHSPSLKRTVGLGWLKRGFFEHPIEVSVKSETTISAQITPF